MVSVIMPAYNVEQYIQQSIQTVINQTYKNWELIIINDGSTDNTALIAEQYSTLDARIRLINQSNGKQASARNAGIEIVKGEYIAFLDSDDLWEPNKLEKQITYLTNYPEIDLVYTNGWVFDYDNLNELKPYFQMPLGICSSKKMYQLEYKHNYIPILSVLVKKSIVDRVGLQEERLQFAGCEDWDYWIRMARNGATFYGMKEKLFYYRRHNSNMSANITKMKLAEINVLTKNYDDKYISKKDYENLMKEKIRNVVFDLIEDNKTNELRLIVSEVKKQTSIYYLHILYLLLVLKQRSSLFIKILNKLNVLL
jgi:teichuronic acid biosynthesis glycosyltransferase TuaG